jgi:hypothetical protein
MYAVCPFRGSVDETESGSLSASELPPLARELLAGRTHARPGYVNGGYPHGPRPQWASTCVQLGSAELPALERVGRLERGDGWRDVTFGHDTAGWVLQASVIPVMPHGEFIVWGG